MALHLACSSVRKMALSFRVVLHIVSMSFLDKATYYDAPVPATIGGCISFVLCFAVMFLVGLLVFSHKKKIEN